MPYICSLDCDVLLLFALYVGFIVFSTNACVPLSVSGPTCICDTEVQGNYTLLLWGEPKSKKTQTFHSMALKIVLIPFRSDGNKKNNSHLVARLK